MKNDKLPLVKVQNIKMDEPTPATIFKHTKLLSGLEAYM